MRKCIEQEVLVFDYHCGACGKRQLITPSRVKGLVNDGAGIVIVFACWCGTPAAIRTGAGATTPRRPQAALTLAS